MDFATVFKTFNSAEANLIASQLEAAGFEPYVVNELASLDLGSSISTSGIRVQVPEAQGAEARALIDSTINSKPAAGSGDISESPIS